MTSVMKRAGWLVMLGAALAGTLDGGGIAAPAMGQQADGRAGGGTAAGSAAVGSAAVGSAAVGGGAAGTGAAPDGQGQTPAQPQGSPPGQMGFMRRGRAASESISDEERDQAIAWSKSALPKTLAYYEESADAARLRIYLRGVMIGYFRRSKDAKSNVEFPELSSLFDRECKNMDELVGLAKDFVRASDTDREALKSKIRDGLRTIIVSRLNERRARIENLRSKLERQERLLKAEEVKVETTTDEQLEVLMNRLPQDGSAVNGRTEVPATQPADGKDDKPGNPNGP